MKRLLIATLAAALTLPAMAQKVQNASHNKGLAIDVSIGADYTRLGYKTQNPTANLNAQTIGGFGFDARLALDFFFNEYFGIGVGADISRYAGGAKLNGQLVWDDVTDTDGERYQHTLALKDWKETQQLTYIEPEVMFWGAIPVGEAHVSLGVGVKYSQAFSAGYKGSGELTHTGYYDMWGLTLSGVDAHGFYTQMDYKPSGALSARPSNLFVVGKVGVLLPLTTGLDLQIHAAGAFCVLKADAVGGNAPLGFKGDRPGMDKAHYFMEDYQSLTATAALVGNYKPLQVGLEVGLRYTIPFHKGKKGGPCNCVNDDTWYW